MTELLRTAANTALHRAQKENRLNAREHTAISNYISYLEDQNAGYQRAVRKATEGGAKFWLESRPDPDSRRARVEGQFAGRLSELVELADQHVTEFPNSDVWLCHAEFELPYGSPHIKQFLERENRASGNETVK